MKKFSYLKAAAVIFPIALYMTACDAGHDSEQVGTNEVIEITAEVSESIMENPSDDRVIYSDADVKAAECDPADPPNIVDALWLYPTEDELYNCDAIAEVTVKNIREISISYTFMGAECVSYETLVTVQPDKVYYSSGEIADEFVVAVPNTSRNFCGDFPEMTKGGKYILFMSGTEELTDDSLKLYNYAEFYSGCPVDIIEINETECTADMMFYSYSDNSEVVYRSYELPDGEIGYGASTGKCTIPLTDFESALVSKIDNKEV